MSAVPAQTPAQKRVTAAIVQELSRQFTGQKPELIEAPILSIHLTGATGEIQLAPLVKAIAAAMYEPDEEMLRAYMNALEQPANAKKEPWHNAKMRKRWRAMMDAAFPP